MEKEATERNSVREPEKEAKEEKTFWAVQVLVFDLEATPLVPQFSLTKPVEAVLEMTKELASKDKLVTLV